MRFPRFSLEASFDSKLFLQFLKVRFSTAINWPLTGSLSLSLKKVTKMNGRTLVFVEKQNKLPSKDKSTKTDLQVKDELCFHVIRKKLLSEITVYWQFNCVKFTKIKSFLTYVHEICGSTILFCRKSRN